MSKNILVELSKPLNINDVDFRVQSISTYGNATIIAYKDARVDMRRLDEVCGGLWQKKYTYIESKNLLFCSVGIKIEDEWIWREDIGTESFTDKEKGQASDAFKRACFNWGIGRELYDYPIIQVKLNADEFTVENNKAKQTWKLSLKKWTWEAEFNEKGVPVKLIGKDENNVIRYQYPNNSPAQPLAQPPAQPPAQHQSSTSTSSTPSNEKKWLNVMDSQKNFTKEWLNVTEAISKKTVTSIEQIKQHYKLSKETEEKINQLFNY